VNKMNNVSNRSSVLPILREHGQFISAILERTQSDHSDCRHWIEGVSTTKPGTDSFFSTLNRAETRYPVKITVTNKKTGPLYLLFCALHCKLNDDDDVDEKFLGSLTS